MATATATGRICSWDNDPHPTFNMWTTGNTEEVVPGIAKPLIATMFQELDHGSTISGLKRLGIDALVPVSELPEANWLAMFGGRACLNLGFFGACLATFQTGAGSGALDQYFTTEEDITSESATDKGQAARIRARLERYVWPQAAASIDAINARTARERTKLTSSFVSAQPDNALLRLLRREIAECSRILGMHVYCISVAAGEWQSQSGALLAEELGDGFEESMVLALHSGLGDVVSSRPGFELWKLGRYVNERPELNQEAQAMSAAQIGARIASPTNGAWKSFARKTKAFIKAYGFRGQSEADLSAADWSEDQTFVLSVIRTNATAPASSDPALSARAAAKAREDLETDLEGRISKGSRRRFRHLLGKGQEYQRNRERSKEAWVRRTRLSRPILLEIQRRAVDRGIIATADDLWFITYHELEAMLGGDASALSAQVAARRKEYADIQTLTIPEMFEAPPQPEAIVPATASRSGVYEGAGVSVGTATGRARVIRSAAAAEEATLEAGEILVAPFTDAAWTPLFVSAAGVVVETGGILSHASTVAREFGIPAVVAVRGATDFIETGQTITVDGNAGTVTVG